MNILFVCTANIVRSFMAERILIEKLKKDKKNGIEVSSAAIIDMHGMPADPTVVEILDEHGFDGSGHNSKLLTEDMVSQADMIEIWDLVSGIRFSLLLHHVHLSTDFNPVGWVEFPPPAQLCFAVHQDLPLHDDELRLAAG